MTIFVTVLHVIVCLMLIAVILLQAGRGQGLGTSLGGGEGTQSIFGTRSADFLSKATSVAAILFLVTCISLDILESRRGASLFETSAKLDGKELDALKEALAELEKKEEGQGEVATKPAEVEPLTQDQAEAPTAPEQSQEAESQPIEGVKEDSQADLTPEP